MTVLGRDGHAEIHGLCNQIGEGGMSAIISSELDIGGMVSLHLAFPPQTTVRSYRAVVRWRDRLQHGFEFFGITSEQNDQVQTFCQALKAKTIG